MSKDVEESQVLQLFRGPGDVCGNVFKNCGEQLAPVFTEIFKSSVVHKTVPKIWKSAVIAPLPKTTNPSQPSDFLALTSLITKCFERLVKQHILSNTQYLFNPLQLAFQESQGVEDAFATLLYLPLSHREKPMAKILSADLSSAFNTIKPDILANVLSSEF